MFKNFFKSVFTETLHDMGLYQTATPRVREIIERREYREGEQPKQLKVRTNQPDDNVIVNFCGLLVDRAVAMLFGKGVEFALDGGDESAAAAYLDSVWASVGRDIFLQNLAVLGAEAGTVFVKLIEVEGDLPRLIALDPAQMEIVANPHDIADIMGYIQTYWIGSDGFMQETMRDENGAWVITNYKRGRGSDWVMVGEPIVWGYDWSPVHHWQNLPDPLDIYGDPDLTDALLEFQDRINFVASNTAKVIRLQGHRPRFGKGFSAKGIELGPDDMPILPAGDADIKQLDAQADISGAMSYLNWLQQSFFAQGREVDLNSLSDKLGALTNFGLRVLYQDAMQKLAQKRLMYAEGLDALNAHILELGGYSDAVRTVWPEMVLVQNTAEVMDNYRQQIELGLMSRETAAQRIGLDYAEEQQKIANEQVGQGDIGTQLLRAFQRGQ